MFDDGISNNPNANPNCPVCKGGGILDDGDMICALVNCPCTGQASKEIVQKVNINFGTNFQGGD